MIPYGNFMFFYIILLLLLPSIFLSVLGKSNYKYNLFATILGNIIIFSNSFSGALSLVIFISFQVILIVLYKKIREYQNNSWVFYIFIFLSIFPLAMVKIVPFINPGTIIGFLGISYLTFKTVQIIIDIRDGLLKNKFSLAMLLYFLLFFPTISSGPIDRYRRFENNVKKTLDRKDYLTFLHDGIHKIFIGFFYKFIIGYLINQYLLSNEFISQNHTIVEKLLYMYSYSLYLFFDFAGYSAFAIGVSYLLGIKTPENFNKPFLSHNIKDFWNRWHMSLSFWFRDYVYMRFVFLVTKNKWIKNKNITSGLGYILLFLLMGVWHGLAFHFILYGLYHAFLIISYDKFNNLNKKYKFWPKNKLTTVVSIIITFNFICFGFYIFSGMVNFNRILEFYI